MEYHDCEEAGGLAGGWAGLSLHPVAMWLWGE